MKRYGKICLKRYIKDMSEENAQDQNTYRRKVKGQPTNPGSIAS